MLYNGINTYTETYYIPHERQAYVEYHCECKDGKQMVYPDSFGWGDGGDADRGFTSPEINDFGVEFKDTLSAALPIAAGSPIITKMTWDSVGKIGRNYKFSVLGLKISIPLKLTLGEYHQTQEITLTCP
jgi:hypothetical protein